MNVIAKSSLVLLLTLAPQVIVQATDYSFGADGLPYLTREVRAEQGLVVVVDGLSELDTPDNALALLYSGRVLSILTGSSDGVRKQQPINVAIIREGDSRPTLPTRRSVVFLYPPFTDERLQQYGVKSPNGGPICLVVNGRFGVVAMGNETREDAIKTYLAAEPQQRLEWSQRHFESADPFLQRSALLETTVQPRAGALMLDLCQAALKSDRVSIRNKDVVFTALQYSKSDIATVYLREFALDPNAPPTLRLSALQAMTSVPGGLQELSNFQSADDSPWLKVESRQILDKFRSDSQNRPNVPRMSPDEIVAQLTMGKSQQRRQAIEAAGLVDYTESIGKALLALASDAKERLAVRELAVERLAAFNNQPAAVKLSTLASNRDLPKELRGAAILAIGRTESGIGERILRSLATTLPEQEFKDLAAALLPRRLR